MNNKVAAMLSVRKPPMALAVVVPRSMDLISGVPPEIAQGRSVRIFKPARTAMQSGNEQCTKWRLDFDINPKWENPLMGWTSSADPLQGLQLKFNSEHDAVAYAKSQGWSYRVDTPHERAFVKKTYAENFLYCSQRPRVIRSK